MALHVALLANDALLCSDGAQRERHVDPAEIGNQGKAEHGNTESMVNFGASAASRMPVRN